MAGFGSIPFTPLLPEVEGNSVRGTARLCDVEKRTVLNILKLAGESCERLLEERVRNVRVHDLELAFDAPIAAVLFSLEEIIGDLHAPVLGSVVLSSTTSWTSQPRCHSDTAAPVSGDS